MVLLTATSLAASDTQLLMLCFQHQLRCMLKSTSKLHLQCLRRRLQNLHGYRDDSSATSSPNYVCSFLHTCRWSWSRSGYKPPAHPEEAHNFSHIQCTSAASTCSALAEHYFGLPPRKHQPPGAFGKLAVTASACNRNTYICTC